MCSYIAEVLKEVYPTNNQQTFRMKASDILKRSSSLRGGHAYKLKKDAYVSPMKPTQDGQDAEDAQDTASSSSSDEEQDSQQAKKKKKARRSSE